MRTLALAAVLVALFAGCRGTARLDRGHTVFQHDCAECHTLTGHDTSTVGGDLALGNLSIPVLASFVRAMPVRLTRHDAVVVAAYVRAAESRKHPR